MAQVSTITTEQFKVLLTQEEAEYLYTLMYCHMRGGSEAPGVDLYEKLGLALGDLENHNYKVEAMEDKFKEYT